METTIPVSREAFQQELEYLCNNMQQAQEVEKIQSFCDRLALLLNDQIDQHTLKIIIHVWKVSASISTKEIITQRLSYYVLKRWALFDQETLSELYMMVNETLFGFDSFRHNQEYQNILRLLINLNASIIAIFYHSFSMEREMMDNLLRQIEKSFDSDNCLLSLKVVHQLLEIT